MGDKNSDNVPNQAAKVTPIELRQFGTATSDRKQLESKLVKRKWER